MSDGATRARRTRARDAAIRELVKQSCLVWDVTRPGGPMTLVAYNPDVPVLREIYVCLDGKVTPSVAKLHRRRGVSLEFWRRNSGETNFAVTKL